MEFSINSGSPEQQTYATIVVGVYESRRLDKSAALLDKAAQGYLTSILQAGDMEGKLASTLMLHNVPRLTTQRVLLVGLGKEGDCSETAWRKAVAAATKALLAAGGKNALMCLVDLPVGQRSVAWRVKQAVLLANNEHYRFDLKSKRNASHDKRALQQLAFSVRGKVDIAGAETALHEAEAMADGQKLTRDLANQPPNICHPQYLGEQAKALGKAHKKLAVEVLGRAEMEKLGMNTLLAVARGSHQPPRLIVMKYNGGGKRMQPVVLVGKGVTFDTGGISLKPANEMDEMKFDMSGAATVLGVMKAVALLNLPINVVGIAPAVENMPGGNASRPGDIVTSMSGQTVEILNTDAEGRLILCDALTYAERFNPACVIDIATLTGACVIALGNVVSGLVSNHDPLAQELAAAGDAAWDRVWPLPLLEEYQDILQSNFADIPNIGNRTAGVITAACFLSRFTKAYSWAHLDIAGTAYKSGQEKGSTGRPVALLVEFLLARAKRTT